jgi:hypothetical protein
MKASWDEADGLNVQLRANTPRTAMYCNGTSVPPHSQRGWIPFLSTNRADFVDHSNGAVRWGMHMPEHKNDPGSRPSTTESTRLLKHPEEVCTVKRTRDLYDITWAPDSDVSTSLLDTLAILRSKIRARMPSHGEIRKAFYFFAGHRARTITWYNWCMALQHLGMGTMPVLFSRWPTSIRMETLNIKR